MRLPDGSVLMHGSAPYDPQKAHEYYLKTRQLKGRKKAGPPAPTGNRQGKPTSFTVKSANGEVKLSPKQYAEQKAYAAARVSRIADKLHVLEAELHKKMSEARKKEAETKKSAKDAAKPDTASEKAAKARDASKYRDKHKQELKNKAKQAADKKPAAKKHDLNTVDGLKSAIADVKKSLHAAVERQRSIASAQKNTG